MNRPEIRIGDVEREGAAWALGEHYALGRLTQDEYDERAGRAWQARTHAELAPLFGDLPQPHGRPVTPPVRAADPAPPPRVQRRGMNVWFFLVLALVILGVVAEAPWVLVPLLIVLVVLAKHRRPHRSHHHSAHRPPHRPCS